MKPLPSLVLLALILVPGAWGAAAGRLAPGAMLGSRCDAAGCDAAAAPGVSDGKLGLGCL